MEMSFASLILLVYSRAVSKSFHSEVRVSQNGFSFSSWCQELTLSFNSSKACVMCKCLGNTMRCWGCTEVFGMPPNCAHAETKSCCRLFRHQADAFSPGYTSPTHTNVPACARINLCILGLLDTAHLSVGTLLDSMNWVVKRVSRCAA